MTHNKTSRTITNNCMTIYCNKSCPINDSIWMFLLQLQWTTEQNIFYLFHSFVPPCLPFTIHSSGCGKLKRWGANQQIWLFHCMCACVCVWGGDMLVYSISMWMCVFLCVCVCLHVSVCVCICSCYYSHFLLPSNEFVRWIILPLRTLSILPCILSSHG